MKLFGAKMIIAVSGVPGTGKTTLSKLLADKLNFTYLDLNKLAEEKNLYSGYDYNRKCPIVDIDKLDKEIPDNSVLDSHYSHLLSSDQVIILKLNIKELRQRLNDKKYSKEKIQENIDAQIMEVIKSDIDPKKKIIEIDTTNKSKEDIIMEIMDKL